jgi:periplasmic protein TonB
MSQNNKNETPPELKSELPVSLGTAALFTIAVILALPLTQIIDSTFTRGPTRIETAVIPPPPQVPDIPPPPEDNIEEDIRDIQEDREPPTLEQLELAINPDLSGLIGGVGILIPDIGRDIEDFIFELRDLSRQPTPIAQPSPIYPPEAQRNRIEGEVTVEFVVRPDGTVDRVLVTRSTNPIFEEPALRAVRRWRFNPGEKDGRPVSARMRITIPFRVGR